MKRKVSEYQDLIEDNNRLLQEKIKLQEYCFAITSELQITAPGNILSNLTNNVNKQDFPSIQYNEIIPEALNSLAKFL